MNLGYYCCEEFEQQATWSCERHKDLRACPDAVIIKSKKLGWILPIRDGGMASYKIYFCPWCGGKIADKIFDEEDLGFEKD